jgi:ABC-type dipeptide/oligopeptide/nickel transport system permease subunit
MSWLRENRKLQLGLLLLAPFVVAAIIPGQLAPHRPDALLDTPFLPPSWHYLLGTDESGRDILSRLIFSARTDLGISLSATLIAAVIGVGLGLAAGYRGGNWSAFSLRLTDVMLAFPSLLLALFLIAVVGPSDTIVVLALVILYIPGFMRLSRGLALQLRERSFIEASHISGGGPLYIVRRHLVPNAIGPLLVGISLTAAYSLLAAATLAYLGLGAPPPAPSWGSMSQAAYNYLFQDWSYGIMPGACILLVSFAYLLISAGIETGIQRGVRMARATGGQEAIHDVPAETVERVMETA